jgi:hypothetical protein
MCTSKNYTIKSTFALAYLCFMMVDFAIDLQAQCADIGGECDSFFLISSPLIQAAFEEASPCATSLQDEDCFCCCHYRVQTKISLPTNSALSLHLDAPAKGTIPLGEVSTPYHPPRS